MVKPASFFVCFGGYILFGVLLTWPLALHLNSTMLRGYGDGYGDIRAIWGCLEAEKGNDASQFLAAPFGTAGERSPRQPVLEALQLYPARIFGDVAAYNLVVLFSFVTTALATFLLLRTVLQQEIPAFFGGLIFGFCPATIMQAAAGHLSFILNAFIPLLTLALLNNKRRRNALSACLVGIAYAFLTLTSLYWGYFAIYFVMFFVAYDCFTQRSDYGRIFQNYLLCALIAGLIVVPYEYQWMLTLLPTHRGALAAIGRNNGLVELVTLSARPWEYLLPSIDHPVLGQMVEHWNRAHLHGSNIYEQTLYLGVVPLSLLLAGYSVAWRKRFQPEFESIFWFFAAGVPAMALMSAPPYIPIGHFKIPTVSYFGWRAAPMFRAYCRFGIWADFFIACAAATVLAHASRQIVESRFRLLCGASFLLLIFEYWTIPPYLAVSVKTPPPIYQWLSQQPGSFIVAEYPMMPNDEAAFYTYTFWQRIHQKKLVNGAAPGNLKAWAYYEKVHDLSKPEVVELLRNAGVRYILVHSKMYEEGQIPEPIKRYFPSYVSDLTYNNGKTPVNSMLPKPYKLFGADRVYAL